MTARQQIVIGRLIAEDAPAVGQLIRDEIQALEYYTEAARRSEIAKHTPAQLLALIRDDPDAVLVAHVDGELAGFCISRCDDGLIWLAWFGVRARWRRCGAGTALLTALERTVRARGGHKLWCDCRTTNEPSKVVLTRAGFRQICTVKNHWYGQDFILWEKEVAAG